MLIIPQDPSDNDTEDGGKTITQAFSFRRAGTEVGGGDRRLLGASLRGPTSWLINPIKSPESIGALGASSLFLPRMVHNNRKCNDSCSPFCVWIILSSVGWQSRRDRAGRTGCPPRRDNRTGRGQRGAGRRAERRRAGILMGVFIL